VTGSYLETALREFARLKQLGEGAFTQLDDGQLFHVSSEVGNSVAILMKHMSGNMLSRWRDFLTTDGEKSDRNRDTEFEIYPADTRPVLFARWESGWQCLFDALAPLTDENLSRSVTIRGEPHTVLEAIQRQLSHYAYHTGQIVQLSRDWTGTGWKTLSIAKGASQGFNEAPRRYLDPKG